MSAANSQIPAYSETTGISYENWAALVEAETHGYVVVILVDAPGAAPYVIGPFEDRADAHRCRMRNVYRAKRDHPKGTVHAFVRLLWKDEP